MSHVDFSCTLTSLLNLLHHFCHQVLVEGLSPLDELNVKAVVDFLEF